jgi:hypothetical protein
MLTQSSICTTLKRSDNDAPSAEALITGPVRMRPGVSPSTGSNDAFSTMPRTTVRVIPNRSVAKLTSGEGEAVNSGGQGKYQPDFGRARAEGAFEVT